MNSENGEGFLRTVLSMGDRGEVAAVELWLDRFIEGEGPRHPCRVMRLLLCGAAPRDREDRWESLDRERLFIEKLLTAYRKGCLRVEGVGRRYLDVMCEAVREYAEARSGAPLQLSDALDMLYDDRKIEEGGVARCADLLLEVYTGKPSPPPPERMDEDGVSLEDALLYCIRDEHPTLRHILNHGEDETLRAGAVLALAKTQGEMFLPRLARLIWKEKGCVAWSAVEAMGKVGTGTAIDQVRRTALEHPNAYARVKAIEVLATSRDEDDVSLLTRALRDRAPVVRFVAGKTLLIRVG